MRSATIAERVAALAERLDSGTLKAIGPIAVVADTTIDAELAVTIALSDVNELVRKARRHTSIPAERWRSAVELLDCLDTLTSS